MRRVWRAIQGLFEKAATPQVTAPATPLPRAPGLAPDWGPEEMMGLKGFLASPTGMALMARGRAIEFQNATAACRDVFHTSHSAGSAKGFGECLDWILSLSRACRVEQDSGPENAGQTDTLPPGEAALRDSMSP